MNRQLRRVGTLVLLMFVALFASSTIIQAVAVDQLKDDPRNIRTLDDSYSVDRGEILDADGNVILTNGEGGTVAAPRGEMKISPENHPQSAVLSGGASAPPRRGAAW